MAGKYNSWVRKTLAERIRKNGGYNARPIYFALSWAVLYYTSIDTVEQARQLMVEHERFLSDADLTLQHPDFDEWFTDAVAAGHSQEWFRWSQDQLIEDIRGDDQGMHMWSPETARKYGFDYTGLGAEAPFRCEFEIWGRGDKHVCLKEFEGWAVDLRGDALADEIEGKEREMRYPNRWCRQLLGMMDEWDKALTTANAEKCGLYYQVDYLMQYLSGE